MQGHMKSNQKSLDPYFTLNYLLLQCLGPLRVELYLFYRYLGIRAIWGNWAQITQFSITFQGTVKWDNLGIQGNFGFSGPLQLLALLCVCGTCHSFLLHSNQKRLGPRFSCCFFGPLPSGPFDIQPVLKNHQSLFCMILKIAITYDVSQF